MKIKISKNLNNNFKKSNKSNLVKVAVQVNGTHGTYQSHRWKNPSSALNLLEHDLKKQGISSLDDIKFKNKANKKLVGNKEIIKDYKNSGTNATLQDFIKQNYAVVKMPKETTYNEVLDSQSSEATKITDEKYAQPKVIEDIKANTKGLENKLSSINMNITSTTYKMKIGARAINNYIEYNIFEKAKIDITNANDSNDDNYPDSMIEEANIKYNDFVDEIKNAVKEATDLYNVLKDKDFIVSEEDNQKAQDMLFQTEDLKERILNAKNSFDNIVKTSKKGTVDVYNVSVDLETSLHLESLYNKAIRGVLDSFSDLKSLQNQQKEIKSNIEFLGDENKLRQSMYPKEIANVSRGKPMSFQEADNGNANPKYEVNTGYSVNCQTCVVVDELRLRGYNVEAVSNTLSGQMPDKVSRDTGLPWIDIRTGEKPKKQDIYGANAEDIYNRLNESIKEDGRYTLEFSWDKSNSGHIIRIYKNQDKELTLYDPQISQITTGKDDIIKYIEHVNLDRDINIMRTDTAIPNLDVVNELVQERKETLSKDKLEQLNTQIKEMVENPKIIDKFNNMSNDDKFDKVIELMKNEDIKNSKKLSNEFGSLFLFITDDINALINNKNIQSALYLYFTLLDDNKDMDEEIQKLK